MGVNRVVSTAVREEPASPTQAVEHELTPAPRTSNAPSPLCLQFACVGADHLCPLRLLQ
jgi:hypothetical protein